MRELREREERRMRGRMREVKDEVGSKKVRGGRRYVEEEWRRRRGMR